MINLRPYTRKCTTFYILYDIFPKVANPLENFFLTKNHT